MKEVPRRVLFYLWVCAKGGECALLNLIPLSPTADVSEDGWSFFFFFHRRLFVRPSRMQQLGPATHKTTTATATKGVVRCSASFDQRCGADAQFTTVNAILSLRSAIASKGATAVRLHWSPLLPVIWCRYC
jgi:hypothetical protein